MEAEHIQNEVQRLQVSPSPETKPGGIGTVQFLAQCPGSAAQTLARAKEVLVLVGEQSLLRWLSVDEWRRILPRWFLDRCVPARTEDEDNKWMAWWRSLSAERQAKVDAEEPWPLEGWLYWMQPENVEWLREQVKALSVFEEL